MWIEYVIYVCLLWWKNEFGVNKKKCGEKMFTCADVYRAESGDADEDLALLQDIPSLPRLPWKLPWKELDNGPGDAGDAVKGDFDLTDSALDLLRTRDNKFLTTNVYNIFTFCVKLISDTARCKRFFMLLNFEFSPILHNKCFDNLFITCYFRYWKSPLKTKMENHL